MSALREWYQGLGAIFRAGGLLARSPKLQKLAVWPVVISTLLLVAMVWLSLTQGDTLLNRLWPLTVQAEGMERVGRWLAQAAVTGLLLLISGAAFFFGSQLIAEPFVDLLSEGTETELGLPPRDGARGFKRWAKSIGWVIVDVAVDLTLFVLVQALLLVLHLIPGIGSVVHLVLGWLANAVFAGASVAGMPLSRRGLHGKARWQVYGRHKPRFLGLGMSVVLVLLVPLASLLTLPLAVIAGTLMVTDLERENRL
ncbi:MAG: EI24 domain-containing protein [Fimbriimonadaceae bacterium]|nr:EI24 domain-containing protein [Fimbriimonadaceae bacterium]